MTGRGAWRWIDERSAKRSPQANMAVDLVLLNGVINGERPSVVRIYSWATRAVTVGKLQDFAEARRTYPGDVLVRRPTGGKAVLHDRDLTITLAAPEAILTERQSRRGVLASHSVIVAGVAATLEQCGVAVKTGQGSGPQTAPGDCFARTMRCDLQNATTGNKLLGSAQARKSGIVLQQMSLRALDCIDILSNDFVVTLQENMMRSLNVPIWQYDGVDSSEEAEAADRAAAWETFGWK